jgi:fatty-acyl-CoA synthase
MTAQLQMSVLPADISQPVLETTGGDVLRRAARECPDRIGLVSAAPGNAERRRWSYAQLLEEAECAARALLGRFEPGERIAVLAPNLPEWVVLQLGAALAGLVLVPLNPTYRQGELAYALRQSQAAGIVYIPEYRNNPVGDWVAQAVADVPTLRNAIAFSQWDEFCATGSPQQALPKVAPVDPAQIQYTSGTTGKPKGAILHHRGITNNGRFVASGLGLQPGDVFMNPLPLFHVAGCVVAVLGTLAARATLILPTEFEPGLVLDMCETERATVMGGVPTILIAMIEHPDFTRRDLSSLRTIGAGGAAVPAALVKHIEATLGVDFSVLFGQTEASCSITKTRPDDTPEDKAETIGLPLPQTEVKIIEPNTGEIVAPGAAGEICTRGYAVMHGYHDMPDATTETIDEEGWLHTGDLGTMDERGYCRIVGRIKDMIIRGGENIFPREIEEVLFTHPGVADVAVVGVPDQKWGEEVAAFVRRSADSQTNEAELHAFIRERLAPHKTPRHWVFLDELPTTASGKIQKFILRERFIENQKSSAAEGD